MVAFSIWMDTHKSRSVHMSQGFYMLQSSHWHGPCTSDDTLPFGWLKKEAAAAASGFSPVWGSQEESGDFIIRGKTSTTMGCYWRYGDRSKATA